MSIMNFERLLKSYTNFCIMWGKFNNPIDEWMVQCLHKEIIKEVTLMNKQQTIETKPEAQELKLYVWEDFCPDYTGGLAFAIATNEAKARKLIKRDSKNISNWGTLTIYPLTKPVGFYVVGGG